MTHHNPLAFIPAQACTSASTPGPNLPAILDALPADAALAPQAQFTRVRQAAFLQRLADCGEVRVAAKAAAVSHQTVYRLRRVCRVFRLGWDAALVIAREQAEEVLATRAMHGVEEEVFYHGEVVATRRRYDSRLLLAHLARLDRVAAREDAGALAERFDDVIAAFADAGEEAGERGEVVLPPVEADAGEGAGEGAAERGERPSGPCNMRSMSPLPEEDEGADEEADGEVVPVLEARLRAMEAARPRRAPTLADQVAQHGLTWRETDELELAQLEAFEAGDEAWWTYVPDTLTDAGEGEPSPPSGS